MKFSANTKKTLIAAAAAAVFAPVAVAQSLPPPPVQIVIPQIVGRDLSTDYLLEQNAINTILSEVSNELDASASLNLGVDNVGSTQFASNQFSTIGWGQTSGSLDTAINLHLTEETVDSQVVRGAAVIDQIITREQLTPTWSQTAGNGNTSLVGTLGGDFASISQLISNTALLEGNAAANGNISIRGLSQIGANAANTAGVNLDYGGTLALTQRVDAFDQGTLEQLVFENHQEQNAYASIDGPSAGLGGLEQIVQNVMIANLGSQDNDEYAGYGNAIIDGAYGENLAQRATQFGSNAVNNAVVGIDPNREGTLTVNQSFGASSYWLGRVITSDYSNPYYWPDTDFSYFVGADGYRGDIGALQGYRSSVSNVAIADAGNLYTAPLSYTPVVLDPVVRNLDQIASFSGNALTLVAPAATDPTQATATLERGGQTFISPRALYTSSSIYQPGDINTREYFTTSLWTDGYAQVPFQLSNLAVASNGDFGYNWRTDETIDYYTPRSDRSIDSLEMNGFYGGRGDAIIEKLGQTTLANVNTVNIVGTSTTTTTNGTTTTTVADAGLTRVNQFNQSIEGLRVGNEWMPSFEPDYGQQYATGAVTINPDDAESLGDNSNNPIFRTFFNTNLERNAPYDYYERGYGANPGYGGLWSNLGSGNLAFAYTGMGTAAVRDIDQVQSLSANTFSTTGSLQGIIDATYSVNAAGVPNGTPSMRQYADGVDVEQGNAALAWAQSGNAMASGSQTLAFSLNGLTVGGTLSGNYEQIVAPTPLSITDELNDSPSVTQANLMVALTDSSSGIARIGDYAVNGTLAASPVTQTIVSSINTMTLANVASATITQRVGTASETTDYYLDPIRQNSYNMVAALDDGSRLMSATLSNINQVVLNKVNTIAAYVPPTAR